MREKRSTLVFVACYLSYCAIYIARLNLSMATPILSAAETYSMAEIGWLGGVFSCVYAVGRLLSGIIGDRVKPWLIMSLGLLIAGVSNLLFGMFPPAWAGLLLWSSNALAQSMLWGAILRLISAIYPQEIAGERASQMATAVTIGNILSVICNSFFINRLGVAFAFVIPGGTTLLCGLFVLMAAKDVECSCAEQTQILPIRNLFKKKELRSAFLPAFLHGIIKDNISIWMTAFFVMQFGIDLEKTTYFVLFIPVAGFIGRICYPMLYRIFWQEEHRVSYVAMIFCIVVLAILLIAPRSPAIAMLCLGLAYAGASIVNTSMLSIMPLRYAKENLITSTSGLLDFATYLGASMGSFAYGYVIDIWGYKPMLYSWLIAAALASVILVYISRLPKVTAHH